MRLNDYFVFLFGPLFLFDVWVQVVVPTLPTLFTYTPRQSFGNVRPVLCSKVPYSFEKDVVFFWSPGPLDQVRIQYFLPTVEALNVTAVLKKRSNLLPVLGLLLDSEWKGKVRQSAARAASVSRLPAVSSSS